MNDLTPAERERLNNEAMLHPAPQIPGLDLRPFNDGTLGLCGELGLTFFTLEALFEAREAGDQAAPLAIQKLGLKEVNRQCLTLLFLLGYEPVENAVRLAYEADAYSRHVLPWVLRQRYQGSLMALVFKEWGRFMQHWTAACFEVAPRPDDSPDPRAPKNA